MKKNNLRVKNYESSGLKYLTRCHYYGILVDIEYVSGATVLILKTYTATEYYGNNNKIRIYVPTDIERYVNDNVTIGDRYYVICSPYRLSLSNQYKHRVDMLLHIFREVL